MNIFFYLLDGIGAFFKTFGIELLFLVAMLIFSVLIAGVLAPLGALSWWAGWTGRRGNAAGGEATESDTEAEALVPPVILVRPVDTTRRVEH
ncbi:MAG: hypothetical protein EOM24_11675, partial [Chloroflexia bacterium]|nr:hypothetical protein [Chloroflexia bacterium]